MSLLKEHQHKILSRLRDSVGIRVIPLKKESDDLKADVKQQEIKEPVHSHTKLSQMTHLSESACWCTDD